jgi:hypothetical protein
MKPLPAPLRSTARTLLSAASSRAAARKALAIGTSMAFNAAGRLKRTVATAPSRPSSKGRICRHAVFPLRAHGVCAGPRRSPVSLQQAVQQQLDALVGDLVGREAAVGAIPAADPAQRAGQHEGGHLRVAGRERAFGHAVFDEAAELGVDDRLETAQLFLQGIGQRVFADANHAPAEVLRDHARIDAHRGLELVDGTASRGAHLGDADLHQVERGASRTRAGSGPCSPRSSRAWACSRSAARQCRRARWRGSRAR